MNPGERFKSWIEGLSTSWQDRLRGWMVSWAVGGIVDGLEVMTPEQKAAIDTIAQKMIDNPDVPEYAKGFLRLATKRGNPLIIVGAVLFAVLMIVPMVFAVAAPLSNLLTQKEERLLKTFRLDPNMVVTAWRRNKAKNVKWFDDLLEQGWSPERQELLKEITEVIPQAQDIIRFALREVYTPEIAEKYGQFQDIPKDAYVDAEKAGLPTATFDKFWAAHWYLPSSSDGFELLHRGIITQDELKALLKANDIMPYWRDQLIKLSWNIPTRVDVRRFWDMRTIDETRLREIYTGLGYHAQDLEDYVLWTKIFVDFPDLLARYKNGWITLDQVKSELVAMGMKPDRAATMIEEKIKKAAPERVAKERELTSAEIIKGVKKDVITWAEGQELLMDMGYDESEAAFKLAIEIAAMAGSPESYAEFKDITQKYRKASGLEGKPMNEEIRKAAAEVIRLTGERDSLQKSITQEQRGLVGEAILPAEATARLTQLQAALRKAEAELSRAKAEYGRLVAELKYTAP